jgi:hypothetical protein
MSLSLDFATEANSSSYHNRGAQWHDYRYEAFLEEAHPLTESREVALKPVKREDTKSLKDDFCQISARLNFGPSISATEQIKANFIKDFQKEYPDCPSARLADALERHPKLVKYSSINITAEVIGQSIVEDEIRSGKIHNKDLFSSEALREIFQTADKVIELTSSDDLLIFIGRSPSFFEKAMCARRINRQIKKIPFSGGSEFYESEDIFKKATQRRVLK